jgi:hypothetical protein
MKTCDFIQSRLFTGKAGTCSSVTYDGEHFYSYGKHYPLLVLVGDEYLLNDSGYSNTTAKHISYARPHSSYVYDQSFISDGTYDSDRTKPENILVAVNEELRQSLTKLEALSSRAFRQKATIISRIDQLEQTRDYLNNFLNAN